jgi:two-component system chemotaxis response regulator CheY
LNSIQFNKILIVDDSSFFRSIIKKMLVEANIGHTYQEAKDGDEAFFQYTSGTPPHLVIMDMVMPDIDGVEATKEILKFDPSAKIIVTSSKENKELVDDAIAAGAKGYLLKPFDADQMVIAVSKQLV